MLSRSLRWLMVLIGLSLMPPAVRAQVDANISPGSVEGQGFGQIAPTHNASIALHSTTGPFYPSISGAPPNTVWVYTPTPGSTLDVTATGTVREDEMSYLTVNGYIIQGSAMMSSFNLHIANVTFPCKYPVCDPANPMSCMSCDPVNEGEISISPGQTVSTSIRVSKGLPGTLTVTPPSTQLQILDANGNPFTPQTLGAGEHWVNIQIRASSTFTGQGNVTAKFVHSGGTGPVAGGPSAQQTTGGSSAADILIVKRAAPVPVEIAKIIVKDSMPEIVGSTKMWVGDSITLEAMPKPAGSTFPMGTPKWSIDEKTKPTGSTVTVPIDPSKTLTIKPDKPGEYKITATCGTSTAPFTLTAYKLTIDYADSDITNTTETTVVGKQVSLTAIITPTPSGQPTYQWTIPGTTVKSYKIDLQKGVKTDLAAADMKSTFITYYWITKLAGKNVTVDVEPAGMSKKTAKATFIALRPTATLTSKTTTDIPAIDVGDNGISGPSLHFGSAKSVGIDWSGTVTTPNNPLAEGTIAFIQLSNDTQRVTLNDGSKFKRPTAGFVLDRAKDDMVFYDSKTAAIMSNATKHIAPNDNPAMRFAGRKKVSRVVSYQLYLMYKPNGADSIWVSLQKLDWNWKCSATMDAAGRWSLDAGSTSYTKDPNGENTNALPTWEKRYPKDIPWEGDI